MRIDREFRARTVYEFCFPRFFRLALPIIQLLVALMLMAFSTKEHAPRNDDLWIPSSWLICRGLNAPAMLLPVLNPRALNPAWDWVPRSILGVDTNEFLFLSGVFLAWYFVGRGVDQHWRSKKATYNIKTAFLVHTPLLALGCSCVSPGSMTSRIPL